MAKQLPIQLLHLPIKRLLLRRTGRDARGALTTLHALTRGLVMAPVPRVAFPGRYLRPSPRWNEQGEQCKDRHLATGRFS